MTDQSSVHNVAPLRIIDPLHWVNKTVPERRWLVPEWIPWGTVASLYGDGGVGKTLAAQMLLTCAATSRRWLGQSVTPVRSVGIFCEDTGDELHRRQDSINRALDVDMADLEHMQLLSRVGDDNLLMTFDEGRRGGSHGELTPFFFQVIQWCKDFGAQFVVIDTSADTFGGNENNRAHVNQFVKAGLGRLAAEIDGTVLLAAHPSAAGLASGAGTGGSTAWNAAVRSRLYLSKATAEDADEQVDPDERVLSRKKANYAAADAELRIKWHDGAFRLTEAEPTGGVLAAIAARSTERAFLEALSAMQREGRKVSDSRNAANFAPRQFLRRPECRGHKLKELERAMEVLYQSGLIKNESYGRKSDERHHIVPAQPDERGGSSQPVENE